MIIDFKKGFSASVRGNAKVWEHDRSKTVGASEVFGCLRANKYKKFFSELAETPEEDDVEWGFTERGNVIENEFAVPCLSDMFGDKSLYTGENQKTLIDGNLSATPDGLVADLQPEALSLYNVPDIGPSGEIVTEIKSFGREAMAPNRVKLYDDNDPTKFTVVYEPKIKHRGQAIVQIGAFRRLTEHKPEYAAVIYISATNLKDIRVATVKYDDQVYLRAKERADLVFDTSKSIEDYPAEGKLTNECTHCPFVNACNKLDMGRFNPSGKLNASKVDGELQETLRTLATRVHTLRKAVKTATAEKSEAESELEELLLSMGISRVGGDNWNVSLVKNPGRKSLDKDKLVEELKIDLEDYTKEGNGYFTMRVKVEE